MTKYLETCKVQCNKKMTEEDVLDDVECGFCDLPYIIIEHQRRTKHGRRYTNSNTN